MFRYARTNFVFHCWDYGLNNIPSTSKTHKHISFTLFHLNGILKYFCLHYDEFWCEFIRMFHYFLSAPILCLLLLLWSRVFFLYLFAAYTSFCLWYLVFGCCILCERSTYKFYLRGCWIFFIAWVLNERKRICNRVMAKGKKRRKSRKKSTKFAFILILLKIIQLKSTKGRTPKKNERKMWIRRIQERCNDGGSS